MYISIDGFPFKMVSQRSKLALLLAAVSGALYQFTVALAQVKARAFCTEGKLAVPMPVDPSHLRLKATLRGALAVS